MAPSPHLYIPLQALQTLILGIIYAALFVCTLVLVSCIIRRIRYSGRVREIVAFEKRSHKYFSESIPMGRSKRGVGVEMGSSMVEKGGWVGLVVGYKYGGLKVDGGVYTDLLLGEDRQPLKLAVTFQQVTWVPQMPGSKTEFCGNSSGTDVECEVAEASGYYDPPVNISRDEIFRLESGTDSTALGYWTESTIAPTTSNISSISLNFGVATSWKNLIPSLGLGIYPTNRSPNHPSYLDSLLQQGKIEGQYVSCYDISNPDRNSGEIILGGVDKGKFTGKLKVLEGGDFPGMVGTPSIMVSTGLNASFGIGEVGKWALLTVDTRYTPLLQLIKSLKSHRLRGIIVNGISSSFLWLPQPIIYNIISTFPVATYDLRPDGKSFPVYTVPCNMNFNPSWTIQFTFEEKVVINVPFNHLVTPIEVPGVVGKRCVLAVQPNDGRFGLPGYTFSYILGAPFWR
ncbi:hypothetical protein TWF481_001968 [Arthrobotrys musiformis]|uniref:Peptidase A1 domain-containing protein n=1 Tax=Arthrobotrys musiformis TaxID=47236 RepID=A0AAV9VUV6_9PEZI